MSTLQGGAGGIVTDGLVLHLDAGNYKSYTSGSLNWIDLSNNLYSGSLNGNNFSQSFGGGITFNGINNRINLSNTIVLSDSFTWSIFCLSNIMTSGTNRQIYFSGGNDSSYFEQSDHDTILLVNSPNATNLELPTSIIPQNKFYNITITRKSDNTFDFYYNGIKQILSNGGSAISGNFFFRTIGSWDSGARYWNGLMSKILVYNRLLTDFEILQNYNSSKKRFGL